MATSCLVACCLVNATETVTFDLSTLPSLVIGYDVSSHILGRSLSFLTVGVAPSQTQVAGWQWQPMLYTADRVHCHAYRMHCHAYRLCFVMLADCMVMVTECIVMLTECMIMLQAQQAPVQISAAGLCKADRSAEGHHISPFAEWRLFKQQHCSGWQPLAHCALRPCSACSCPSLHVWSVTSIA